MTYWLNIHWADGTESTYEDSRTTVYKTKAAALKHGEQWHRDTGCPVFVIGDGKVVAEFPPPLEPKKRGRKKGDPNNTGRSVGVSVPCWWGCGFIVSGSTVRTHWANCPKRPKE
jgi:hypothetical protein